MYHGWISKALVSAFTLTVLALFRRFAPPPSRVTSEGKYDQQQVPEPLATGAIGAAMWSAAIVIALSFFLLKGANHLWALSDGPAEFRRYVTPVIWCFLPGCAALAIPWPLTIWLLRKLGRTDEAESIVADSSEKSGMDTYRVMKWLAIGVVAPIAFFTLLAVPIHLSISNSEALVGHYASLRTERFPFNQARRAVLIDGEYRGGGFHPRSGFIVDFADGRRLDATVADDGGSQAKDNVIQLLLAKTGLHPEHVRTIDEIAPQIPK